MHTSQRMPYETSPNTKQILPEFSSSGKTVIADGWCRQAHQQAAMADYYPTILSCIDSVLDKARGKHNTRWKLNEHQCSYVADELSKVSKSLQAKVGSKNSNLVHDIHKTVLLQLHAAVTRAGLLVERCYSESSASRLAAAMTSTDIKEEVIAILLDLYQWTFVLDMAIASLSDERSSTEKLELLRTAEEGYQRLSKKLHSSKHPLHVAAVHDHKALLESIADSMRNTNDDYVYGVYLKSRLAPAEGELQNVPKFTEYKILQPLGQGASGVVLKVIWMGHQCGVKISSAVDKTEATILNQLHHPNIVRFFHYWEAPPPDRNSHIVMELMPSDLQKHIAREVSRQSNKKSVGMPFLLSVAIDAMLQVAEAMRYVHDQKLTHRDLKTSNILVKPVMESMSELHTQGYLEIKLADFGLAKGYMDSSISQELTRKVGTTIYGAPEIFGREETQSHRNFPPKADVWSFGMICAEILTGRIPFADERSKANLHHRIKVEGLRPKLPKECPEYLQFCIKSCWELQPQRRPSFVDLCRMLRHARFLNLGLFDCESNDCLFAYSNRAGFMNVMKISSTKSQVDPTKSRFSFGFGLISNFCKRGRRHKPMQPTTKDSNYHMLQPTPEIMNQVSPKKEDDLLPNSNELKKVFNKTSIENVFGELVKPTNRRDALPKYDKPKKQAPLDKTKETKASFEKTFEEEDKLINIKDALLGYDKPKKQAPLDETKETKETNVSFEQIFEDKFINRRDALSEYDKPKKQIPNNETKEPKLQRGKRHCLVCHQQTKQRCSRCKSVFYCSRECQKKHWYEVHKLECKTLHAKMSTTRKKKDI